MEIVHYDGVTLEHIVSDVFSCDRGAMGGIVNSGEFERQPLLASYLVIAKLYNNSETQDNLIDKFINKWGTVFEYPDENHEYTFQQYLKELRTLIQKLRT